MWSGHLKEDIHSLEVCYYGINNNVFSKSVAIRDGIWLHSHTWVLFFSLFKKKENENEKILKYMYLLRDYKSEGTFPWGVQPHKT